MWLIFLIFCFIFEECALELPSLKTLDPRVMNIMRVMTALIAIMTALVIYSFVYNIKAIYFVSFIM
jgi:hypothetical protein